MTRGVRGGPVFEIPDVWLWLSAPGALLGRLLHAKRGLRNPAQIRPLGTLVRLSAADLDVELAIPAEYTRATTPKHWRRPDARAGTPPYYVSPIADMPPTEV